jgi:hypothetical protein
MAKEKEGSIYKRRILDFKAFAKGKDSVQEPKKHLIKEGAERTPPTSREEMLKLLHQKFPNVIAKNEPFQKDDTRGIWSGAENSSFIDKDKKISAFNPVGSYSYNQRLDKNYEEEVHKTLHKFLKDHGWYTEFYDNATPIFYPIWGANESLMESDAPSDEMVKDNVYKIYDRNQNGKLVHRAARFDGLDGAKGNKFALVNFPKENFEWIKPADMASFYFVKIDWKPQAEYKKKK